MNQEQIKNHYSTIYITLISILLGVALGDLVSVFRSISQPNYFEWLGLVFIILLIMNAWISYSLHAISVRLIPTPADAVNVFAISVAHFALNSFIGKPHYQFYLAVCFYCLITTGTILFIFYRASQFNPKKFYLKSYARVIFINIWGAVIAGIVSWFSFKGMLTSTIEIATFIFGYINAVIWVLLYWKVWKSQLID